MIRDADSKRLLISTGSRRLYASKTVLQKMGDNFIGALAQNPPYRTSGRGLSPRAQYYLVTCEVLVVNILDNDTG